VSEEELFTAYKHQAVAFEQSDADAIVIETLPEMEATLAYALTF
jgi:methionine synthase I (cobalamin-dependent)